MCIDLSKIPLSELKKQYVNFKSLVKSPPMFGDPLMLKSKQRRLNEGIGRKTLDIEDVRKSIIKNYLLDEWQFQTRVYVNNIKVDAIIPHIGDNEDLFVEDMMSMGYYVISKDIIDIDNMKFLYFIFDARWSKTSIE